MAERKKLLLRLDPGVYNAIAKWASDDLRSVNAQIEYALRLALHGAGRNARTARPGEPEDRVQPEPSFGGGEHSHPPNPTERERGSPAELD